MAENSTIENTGLEAMLPESIAHDETVDAAARSIREALGYVVGNREVPALFARIDGLESGQLDHLAVMFDVTTWRDTWSVELKRSVLRMIFQTKCRMGTASAVREALSSLGSAATVKEWWETQPKGAPHTFTVDATLSGIEGVLTSELQEDLMSLLDEAKPARALYTFNLRTAEQGGAGFTGATRALAFRRLKNF